MSIELIALDIDGTIRSNEYPVSDRTREAVEAVRRSGALVTLATGRMFYSAIAATTTLNITAPIVSYQGAHIARPDTSEVLWHRPLTPDMARKALSALSGWDREILACYDDEVYVDVTTPWIEGYSQRNHREIHVVDDLHDLAEAGLTRLVVVGEDDEIHKLVLRLSAQFNSSLQIIRSLPYLCEILHPRTGKDVALAWLCRHLGIPRERTAAFGNGREDAAMLRWAGVGVAVAGSDPVLFETADRIAPPPEEDGVAQILENLLKQGLVG